MSTLNSLPPPARDVMKKLTSANTPKFQHISDSLIAWVPVKFQKIDEYIQCLNTLMTTFYVTSSIYLSSLAQGYPMRGGIDLDGAITIEPGGNEIYGPALIGAYKLESEKAKYPRILVGDGVLKFLDVEFRTNDEIKKKYIEITRQFCLDYIYNDEEGPNVPLDNAVGGLDYNGAHTGPQSYHYHLEPKAWSDDDGNLIGIMADGFFLYGRRDHDGNYPTDLDASGGHTSTTQHTNEAEYHYHIQNELYLNQYYILFPGDYQGSASSIN